MFTTKQAIQRPVPGIALPPVLLAVVSALLLWAAPAAVAQGPFGMTDFDGEVRDAAGETLSQAGAHPHTASTTLVFDSFATDRGLGPIVVPNENVRDSYVDLPLGFVGDAAVTPTRCTEDQLARFAADVNEQGAPNARPDCPPSSQVGTAHVVGLMLNIIPSVSEVPVYAMVPPRGVAAQFGFRIFANTVHLDAVVRPEDNGLRVRSRNIPETLTAERVTVDLWGVPADPSHDAKRGVGCLDTALFGGLYCDPPQPPIKGERKPFLTNPTACTPPGVGLMTRLRVTSWPGSQATASFESHDDNGDPLGPTGCERVPFEPALQVQTSTSQGGAPTGLAVDIAVPQNENPDGIASAHVKRVDVQLPEGMTVNPSSASGLQGCSPSEIGLGTDSRVACPDGSKIGDVAVTTPLLDERLDGSVYLAQQGNRAGHGSNPFGSLMALYLVVESEDRGITVKLAGRVDADPVTGRLTTSFDNNPQLPFSRMQVKLKTGARAPLTLPAACGSHDVVASFVPWSAADPNDRTTSVSSFDVTSGPDGIPCSVPAAFEPAFEAGSTVPLAGAYSPFAMRIGTSDRDRELRTVDVDLADGLLAKLRGVQRCGDAAASASSGRSGVSVQQSPSCPAASQIGTTIVGVGTNRALHYPLIPGSEASGRVFLTDGYKGAPFGLAIEVPAVAGPFDLGTVMVRAALFVDPDTAQAKVVSDPLPRILEGIPLNVRDVQVSIDRPGFTTNPTSCDELAIGGRISAQDGTVASRNQRFQVGACRALDFDPKLALRFTGKRAQLKTGGNPGVRGVLTHSGSSLANVATGKVTMPKAVVLDPTNTVDPKLLCGYDDGLKGNCPASSIIGRASAISPLLDRKLSGPVHLVQGIRFGPTGNRIRTTPTLLVKLKGDVEINLRATTTTDSKSRLVTTFTDVPDAAVSRFAIHVNGGRKGILVVTRTAKGKLDLCTTSTTAALALTAHNKAGTTQQVRGKAPCAKRKPKRLELRRKR